MCLMIVKKPTGTLLKRNLKEAFRCNDDGAGFMYNHDGKVVIDKGYFGFRRLYKAFRAAEREHPESTFVLHFRLATHGATDSLNCHPFKVHDSLGFAHNGIMRDLGNKTISDSAEFCWKYLTRLPNDFPQRPEIWRIIEKFATHSQSKFALLDGAGMYYIANEDAGHWKDDCWFSNYSYLYVAKASYSRDWQHWYGNGGKNWTTYDQCKVCGQWFKRYEMMQAGDSNYCSDCWDILTQYTTVQCPNCHQTVRLNSKLTCDFCGESMDEDDIDVQLAIFREHS